MIEYRQELGIGTKLKTYLGIDTYNEHQKKLVQNVKYCSDNQWQWVNSYYDGDVDSSWEFFKYPNKVFDCISSESMTNIFRPGMQHWGNDAVAYMKDTKFSGKEFKDKVVFYYTVKLYEEAVDEIDFDMDMQKQVLVELEKIKNELNI